MSSASSKRQIFCRYHPKAQLIEDYRAGDMICSQCGLVVGDRVIDVGPEWRTFADDSGSADRSRVGQVEDPVLGDAGLTTRISADGNDRNVGAQTLIRRQNRSGGLNEQSLTRQFREIALMGERLGLPRQIVMTAQHVYQAIARTRAVRARSCDDVVASCLYIACRKENVPRSFKEICGASNANKREIGRCFKLIVRTLEMSVETVTSDDFVARFCSRIRASERTRKLALQISLGMTKQEMIGGRSPVSIAATSICIAALFYGEEVIMKDVCTATGAAESTIRQVCRSIFPRLHELLPEKRIPPALLESLKLHSLLSDNIHT